MDERPISLSLKLLALLMFIFLLAPLLVVLPISFSGDNYMMFPPTTWSARWYGAIFTDAKMVSAFTTSIALACVVGVAQRPGQGVVRGQREGDRPDARQPQQRVVVDPAQVALRLPDQ